MACLYFHHIWESVTCYLCSLDRIQVQLMYEGWLGYFFSLRGQSLTYLLFTSSWRSWLTRGQRLFQPVNAFARNIYLVWHALDLFCFARCPLDKDDEYPPPPSYHLDHHPPQFRFGFHVIGALEFLSITDLTKLFWSGDANF